MVKFRFGCGLSLSQLCNAHGGGYKYELFSLMWLNVSSHFNKRSALGHPMRENRDFCCLAFASLLQGQGCVLAI